MNTTTHHNIQQERVAQLREYCEDHAILDWSDQDLEGLLRAWDNSAERAISHLRRNVWVVQHQLS